MKIFKHKVCDSGLIAENDCETMLKVKKNLLNCRKCRNIFKNAKNRPMIINFKRWRWCGSLKHIL
jgi:hypothetical protein